ncbi:thioredoxin family protein [Magnetococcales bacterium HHB-1]
MDTSLSDIERFTRRIDEISWDQPALVLFSSPMCGPCKEQYPILKGWVKKATCRVHVLVVDVSQYWQLANEYGVDGVPTIKFFWHGRDVATGEGLLNHKKLHKLLKKAAKKGNISQCR